MSDELNDVLKQLDPGALPTSISTASRSRALAEKYQGTAQRLAAKHSIPPALILGLMSRESAFGKLLDKNGRGDFGHGFGILQVDDRSHKPVGTPYSEEHLDQAMGIFNGALAQMRKKYPTWTPAEQLAGATASYNAGHVNGVEPTSPTAWAQMDGVTTGKNYSRDVWAQAQWFADNLTWGAAGSGDGGAPGAGGTLGDGSSAASTPVPEDWNDSPAQFRALGKRGAMALLVTASAVAVGWALYKSLGDAPAASLEVPFF